MTAEASRSMLVEAKEWGACLERSLPWGGAVEGGVGVTQKSREVKFERVLIIGILERNNGQRQSKYLK